MDLSSGRSLNTYSATLLEGTLGVETLKQSISQLIRRHEPLRTRYRKTEEKVMQEICMTGRGAMEVVDLQRVAKHARESQLLDHINSRVQLPLDISNGETFRCALIRLEKTKHLFLLVGHCSFFDEHSIGIFLRDLEAIYGASLEERPAHLPSITKQYVDVIEEQMRPEATTKIAKCLSYWGSKLSGELSVVELPQSRLRNLTHIPSIERRKYVVSKGLTRALRQLCYRRRTSLYVLMLAAFKALLYRYTWQTDIIVGSRTSLRDEDSDASLVGWLTNSLVLRTHLRGDLSFDALISKVRRTVEEANGHKYVALEVLASELGSLAKLKYQPPFRLMLVEHIPNLHVLNLPNLHSTSYSFRNVLDDVDLVLNMAVYNENLQLDVDYDSNKYSGDDVEQMMSHFQSILRSVTLDSSVLLNRLLLLTQAERHKLIGSWSQEKTRALRTQTLTSRFEEQVSHTPDRIATTCGDEQLSYDMLNRRANQLARLLQRLGVNSESCVGLCVKRSNEMAIGMLAILKAGGVCVPLDPESPKDRLEFMANEARLALIITQSKLLKNLPDNGPAHISIDLVLPVISHFLEDNLGRGPNPDDTALIMYTSGSTGNPKGVAVCHRGECSWHLPEMSAFHLSADDSFLVISYSAIPDMFWPWFSGARAVIAQEHECRGGAPLVNLISRQAISVVHLFPTMLRSLLEDPNIDTCSSLRHVRCGGEPLSVDLHDRFFQLLKAELHNYYALTEAGCTVWRCNSDSQRDRIPIGRPTTNTRIYLLDLQLEPVPSGFLGEICFGGPGLALGYLKSPSLTAEKFIPDPFSGESAARLFRTGDLGRFRPDGNIEFLGRIDNQVQIRGFRVELGEIETVLRQHPMVRRAAVVVRETRPGTQLILAYIESDNPSQVSHRLIRPFLEKRLPKYMIPATFIPIESIPSTPSGKIDRHKLSSPRNMTSKLEAISLDEGNATPQESEKMLPTQISYPRPSLSSSYIAPRNEVEQRIVNVWEELLGIKGLGIEDDFFELGGHSLLAVEIEIELQDIFNIDLPLSSIYEVPTVVSLAEHIQSILTLYDFGGNQNPDHSDRWS